MKGQTLEMLIQEMLISENENDRLRKNKTKTKQKTTKNTHTHKFAQTLHCCREWKNGTTFSNQKRMVSDKEKKIRQ